MKKFIMLEDEPQAAEKLMGMLKRYDDEIDIIAQFQRVEDAVHWIGNNPAPDLAFFDIQLADGISFDIFTQVKIEFPVIFTTAYDEYLLKAMEVQSVDYLLKPVSENRLHQALEKVNTLRNHFIQSSSKIESLQHSRKDRLLVKKGADFVSLPITRVRYFFTAHKIVFAKDENNTIFIVDKPLTDIMEMLDPSLYFRVNRKYIVHIDSIEKFRSDSGKILLFLNPPADEEVVVSKETAPHFRNWIEG